MGGKFDRVRATADDPGIKVSNVAANVASGKPLERFRPWVRGASGEVHAVVAQGDRVFIGGNVSSVAGNFHRNLAAVDAVTGSLTKFRAVIGSGNCVGYEIKARGPCCTWVVGPEVLETNPTGVFFDAQTLGAIKAAVKLFETHKNEFLPENCRLNAQRFGRERFHRELTAVMQDLWGKFQRNEALE
jgi:hypothetical protein